MATLGAARAMAVTMPGSVSVPIDHDHLARYTFGNRELEIEVLNLFAEQSPAYLDNMRDTQTEKGWRDAAHTLKGSARAVGALHVAELAERAEALRSSTDAAAKRAMIDALADAIDEARAHIAALEVAF